MCRWSTIQSPSNDSFRAGSDRVECSNHTLTVANHRTVQGVSAQSHHVENCGESGRMLSGGARQSTRRPAESRQTLMRNGTHVVRKYSTAGTGKGVSLTRA